MLPLLAAVVLATAGAHLLGVAGAGPWQLAASVLLLVAYFGDLLLRTLPDGVLLVVGFTAAALVAGAFNLLLGAIVCCVAVLVIPFVGASRGAGEVNRGQCPHRERV